MKQIVISLILISSIQCEAMHFIRKKKSCDSTSSTEAASKIIDFILFEEVEYLENFLKGPRSKNSLNKQRSKDKKTALHLAVIPLCTTEESRVQSRLRMVKALVSAGIEKGLKDSDGKTAAQCLQEEKDFEGKQQIMDALNQCSKEVPEDSNDLLEGVE